MSLSILEETFNQLINTLEALNIPVRVTSLIPLDSKDVARVVPLLRLILQYLPYLYTLGVKELVILPKLPIVDLVIKSRPVHRIRLGTYPTFPNVTLFLVDDALFSDEVIERARQVLARELMSNYSMKDIAKVLTLLDRNVLMYDSSEPLLIYPHTSMHRGKDILVYDLERAKSSLCLYYPALYRGVNSLGLSNPDKAMATILASLCIAAEPHVEKLLEASQIRELVQELDREIQAVFKESQS